MNHDSHVQLARLFARCTVNETGCWVWNGSRFRDGYADVPSCVNPSHLFVGTASDNQRDCLAKGRKRTRNGLLVPAPGYCSRGHNKEDVGSRVSKDGYTYCRLCLNRAKRDRDRARRERRAHA